MEFGTQGTGSMGYSLLQAFLCVEVIGRAASVTGSGRKPTSGFPEMGRGSTSGTKSGSGDPLPVSRKWVVGPLPVSRKWAIVPKPLPGVPKDRKHWKPGRKPTPGFPEMGHHPARPVKIGWKPPCPAKDCLMLLPGSVIRSSGNLAFATSREVAGRHR